MSIAAVISTHAQNNCYIQLDEASGFDVSPYQADLEARACELVAAFPDSSYADSFKVYSFGFYVNLAYYDTYSYPQAFSDMKEEVAGLSPYYLLIGRQSDPEGIFTKFWVDVKLPETGVFECLKEEKRKMIQQQVVTKINQDFYQFGNDPNKVDTVEILGMILLQKYIEDYSQCCSNGVYSSNCPPCTYSNLEISCYLQYLGFTELKDHVVSITPQVYAGNLESPVRIELTPQNNDTLLIPLTEEIYWFLGRCTIYGLAKARVIVFRNSNCDSFANFQLLDKGANIYTEDIVVLDKEGEIKLFYKINESITEEQLGFKPDKEEGEPEALPIVVVWLLKRSAMAGAGVATHIGTELIFEKWFGGYEDWDEAWDAVDLDWWEIVQAGVEGAIGADAKKIQIFSSVFTQAVDYLIETDGDQITWEGVFSNAVLGGVQGLVNIYSDELMESFTKRLDKYGPKLVHQSLEKVGAKELFFKFKSFRKTFIGILWDSPTDETIRGKLIEEVLKFNTFKQADGWQWVGPINGPADYVHNAGWTSQVKSMAKINPATDWTNMRKSVNKACDQLIASLNEYPGNNLRMDIPVPDGQLGYKGQAFNKIKQHIQSIPDYYNNPSIKAMVDNNKIFIGTYSN